jgi:predicted RNA-binding Zn-ribbon protein involved in translation (DUF1610 family)
VPRPRVPDSLKRAKRQARQARYRQKPKVREARREANKEYYDAHRDEIKTRVRSRQILGGDPERIAKLRERFRIIGPGEPIPPDTSLTTQNACGNQTNNRADMAFILESRWPQPDSPWGFVTGCPDLSTLLGLGGKGQNLDLKEFIRDEMLRRFPDRYPHREDLPNEEEVLRRNVGPPDKRETEKRVREARLAKLSAEVQCPNCSYNGPMLPTGKGPYLAEKFTTPEAREKLGVAADDLLSGLFCPQCRGLVVFRPEIDLSPARGEGTTNLFRCKCGFTGRLAQDPSTGEYNCPECGLVVGMTLEDRTSPRRSNE